MNKRSFVFLFILLVFSSPAGAQKRSPAFILKGSINTDTGTIFLVPMGANTYYPGQTVFSESKIINGKFEISDTCRYPSAFRFGITKNSALKYISDYFFIEPGVQNIQCNIDSLREMPLIENGTMKELMGPFSRAMSPNEIALAKLETGRDSLYKIYHGNVPDSFLIKNKAATVALSEKRKQILYRYAKQHPGSYIVLWELIRYLRNGYTPVLDSIYKQLSFPLKQSYAGKELANKLALKRLLETGKIFPPLSLLNMSLVNKKLQFNPDGTKYILVDFWFSHCIPCISQFPEMKKMYETYLQKGFSIIGISTDSKENISNWKAVIKKYELGWPQYLDLSGKIAARLSINAFPTNFLLDGNGKILQYDLSPAQLAEFLKQKL